MGEDPAAIELRLDLSFRRGRFDTTISRIEEEFLIYDRFRESHNRGGTIRRLVGRRKAPCDWVQRGYGD